MATVKNITPRRLSLFTPEAPPVEPGDEVTLSDARFVNRAWPKSTWEVVEPPEGFVDVGPDDAYLFVLPELVGEEGPELVELPKGTKVRTTKGGKS